MAQRKIVFIGAGNVAWHLAPALENGGVGAVVQVYSRHKESAENLSRCLGAAEAVSSISEIRDDADVYIISLVDDAIAQVVKLLPKGGDALWLHTSGSVGMEVLSPLSSRYGVFYPLQTFSKGVELNVPEIPLFVEGVTPEVEEEIRSFALPVFKSVYNADSQRRRMMHIAAVFGCNFVNYLWTVASDVLGRNGLPFEVLRPLLEETMRKALAVTPEKGQTGPAKRGDRNVINRHLSELDGEEGEIYSLLSEAIIRRYNREEGA